jgi:hypothetical protein
MNAQLARIHRHCRGLVVVVLAFLVQVTLATAAAEAATMGEKEKIDALIHSVEMRSDLKFIRLGTTHSASEAAQMLRTQLWYAGSQVKTVDDFIDHVASATVSGSTYYVRFPDGKQVPSAEFLRAELKRITQRTASAGNSH